MSNIKIKLNTAAVGELLKGSEVRSILDEYGIGIASQAGSGYSARTHYSGQRLICNVYAESAEAKQDNLEHNTLLKALGHLPGRRKQ